MKSSVHKLRRSLLACGQVCRQHYSSGISITSSSMISPCGMLMRSGGLFLQLSPEKGLHQDRDNGPPNAICMASRHGTFPHFPVSPFRRSIPCRRQQCWSEVKRVEAKEAEGPFSACNINHNYDTKLMTKTATIPWF